MARHAKSQLRFGGTSEHHENRAIGLSNSVVTLANKAASAALRRRCGPASRLLTEASEVSGMMQTHFRESGQGSSTRERISYAHRELDDARSVFNGMCLIGEKR